MAGERKYTRIPPESTGDRVLLLHTQEMPYTGQVDPTYIWKRDKKYTITGNSGPTIEITLHRAIEEVTGVSGYIVYEIDADQNYINAPDPIAGQEIREGDISGTIVAYTSGSPYCVYINGQAIVGHDNSTYSANVDRFGALYTRFAEGAPEVTAFGQLRSSGAKLLAQYDFSNDTGISDFVNSQEGKGKKVWEADIGAIKMTVSGDAVTQDRVTNTSTLFHPCVPGSSILFVFAARCGLVNEGVIRNWGPFDADDGFFFQQNGTKLRVAHRYTLDGQATGTHPVDQSQWNKDTLDGSFDSGNPSGMKLDITDLNLYWVDYQFIGGGRTRWGVYYEGERIVCHEMYHSISHNALGNPNRPLCWAIANRNDADGNSPTGSPAEFWAYGGGVYLESDVDPLEESAVKRYSTATTVPAGTTSWKFAFSLRPALTLPIMDLAAAQGYTLSGSQRENHTIYSPQKLDVMAWDSNGDPVRLQIRLMQDCVVRGVQTSPISYTTVLSDTASNHISHGPEFARFSVYGQREFEFADLFNTLQRGTVRNGSDQSFARNFQDLALYEESADPESTGVNRIVVTVKDHPIWGPTQDKWYFDDKGPVNFRDPTNGTNPEVLAGFSNQGNLKTAEGDWYYLSFINRNKAWLYASTADIDDDRNARVLNVSSVSGTIDAGDVLTLSGGVAGTCTVLEVNGTAITVEGRSASTIDVGNSGSGTTDLGATTFTVDSVSLSNAYPLDYKTSLTALAIGDPEVGTPVLTTGTTLADTNSLFGPAPAQAAWYVLVDPSQTPTANDMTVEFTFTWKERAQ